MNKPLLAPRRPPDPAAMEAFIGGKKIEAPAARPITSRKIIERQDGRKLHRETIYLELELARRLAVEAASSGQEKSAVVAAALEAWLARPP